MNYHFLSNIFLKVFSSLLYAAYVDCPVFKNDKIVEQPADLLTLTQNYVNAAYDFIETNASKYL